MTGDGEAHEQEDGAAFGGHGAHDGGPAASGGIEGMRRGAEIRATAFVVLSAAKNRACIR